MSQDRKLLDSVWANRAGVAPESGLAKARNNACGCRQTDKEHCPQKVDNALGLSAGRFLAGGVDEFLAQRLVTRLEAAVTFLGDLEGPSFVEQAGFQIAHFLL